MMETKIGQLANAINSRPQGSLPSNTKPNPRQDSKAQCQAVTLRNGKELQEVVKETAKAKENEVISKENEKEIGAPLEVSDYEMMTLIEEYSAIIQNKLPPKLKDPGSFMILCKIGTHFSGRALCDLGASINLMPYSIYRTLGLGEAKPTSITLQLADRSLTYPRGVIEDILVKVDKFIFPTNFIVLDMEDDCEIPIILGRPFLATGRTLIDVQKGELTMRVQDQQITFNVFNAMKFPNESDKCFSVSLFDNLAGNESIAKQPLNPLERALLDLIDEENEEDLEVVKTLDASKFFKSKGVESLERIAPSKVLKPLIEEPPALELKPLPSHFRFTYLGESDTLPVLISSLLVDLQVEKLLRVLRDHKCAIGSTIADIKGISPSFWMYKILLKDNQKPFMESQRRLNPIMKEVVKKEIIKCHVQCVSNKGGITMVPNMHNELIPTRTVTGWRVCMDYRKLNKVIRKEHFSLPFIDQILDRLAGKEFYYFLYGYSGYNQIAIAPEHQEKTTFTVTFQRCMMAIFTDMVENFLEGNSFDEYLNNLSSVLKRCEDTNFVLNWEKCYFMVQEGIVLGYKIFNRGIEVDKGITIPDWTFPFELMCDVSDFAIGAVLRQRKDKIFHSIYYASKTLNDAQLNYTTTEKELLAIVFACDKFIFYLVGTRYLIEKKDAKPRLIRWVLLLQEFDLEIQDRKGTENQIADHLFSFLDEQLIAIVASDVPWYADILNYLTCGIIPFDLSTQQKKKNLFDTRRYFWDHPFLFKQCSNNILRRCVPEVEINDILEQCHASPYGGHFQVDRTTAKILQSGFYWPNLFKDAHLFVGNCDRFVVDYVSKWVEAIAVPSNDSKVVVNFIKKNIFIRFGIPRAIISDEGTHFCNRSFEALLSKYGGQVEVSNQEIKRILEKTVSFTRKDWFKRLDEALWAYRTAFKIPIGISPYNLVFGKKCHLPVKFERNAYWAIRKLNFNMQAAREKRLLQLNELDEFPLQAYKNAKIYKEKTKRWHDKKIVERRFEPGQYVLLFNSRLKLVPGKLKSRWSGPFHIIEVFPHGEVELENKNSRNRFKVNVQRIKHYWGGVVDCQNTKVTLNDVN
ncbi:DNA-directed DNA polymerase [Handroanthus impetiginosus]|uniref:DNA-directed DNA polymerase n=1 Tax=Handroanthus impetiginosus TaxID=429701 RepID=A0A2G9H6F6_9LAMI|nr:DNA-directed DNA polymerase [Handroanthus impetiginosus]